MNIHQNADSITAYFADGMQATGDLLIGSDRSNSTVRELLFDGKPTYSGYAAWPGLITESELPDIAQPPAGHFAFSTNRHSHILAIASPMKTMR